MTYPTDQAVQVYVSYDQRLDYDGQLESGRPYVQPIYVLRTGALWQGTIGEATITMSAPDGGAFLGGPELFSSREPNGDPRTTPERGSFLGPDQADEASEGRLVWRLRDVEPMQDVGATYIASGAWRALREAEDAAALDSASADDYLRAAQAAARLLGRWGPYGLPASLVERYPTKARTWSQNAVRLDPNHPAAWIVHGDLERFFAMPPHKHHDELECWPAGAEIAYTRAASLGAPEAADRLTELEQSRDRSRQWRGLQGLPPELERCP
jgi:hypothetical protein